jgi:hypothetical protein
MDPALIELFTKSAFGTSAAKGDHVLEAVRALRGCSWMVGLLRERRKMIQWRCRCALAELIQGV